MRYLLLIITLVLAIDACAEKVVNPLLVMSIAWCGVYILNVASDYSDESELLNQPLDFKNMASIRVRRASQNKMIISGLYKALGTGVLCVAGIGLASGVITWSYDF